MDKIILKLKTAEECIQLAKKYTALAREARRRSIELRAFSHGNERVVEIELLKTLYAYE